jgi:hypothetical protein
VDLDLQDKDGYSALMKAAEYGESGRARTYAATAPFVLPECSSTGSPSRPGQKAVGLLRLLYQARR